jgi:hypothetical protein
MAPARISTWQERLRACLSWRQRLLHVFGVPSAVGALTAVASAAALNPEAGLALGVLTAGTGVLLAGYYVVAGFDRGLVAQLEQDERGRAFELEQSELSGVLLGSEPALRAQLERCLSLYAAIDAVFSDGIDDAVEAILQNSRPDLKALQLRAVNMVKLHQRLSSVIRQSNVEALRHEIQRMDRELAQTAQGPVRDALVAARESSVRALEQWQNAFEKRAQVQSVLTLIENNLQEFKLAMELRKADAALGAVTSGQDMSELQARLTAAGEACDELVGRAPGTSGRRSTRRKVS